MTKQPYATSEVRQRQIAEAALELIAEEGLAKFTVTKLADRLPITGGAIFRHFGNKQEIVLAAIDRLAEDLFPVHTSTNGRARLREFFFSRAHLIAGPQSIGQLFFSDDLARAAGPGGVERVAALRTRSMVFIRTCLRDIGASGVVLRDDIPVEELMRLVSGMLLTFRNEPPGGYEGDTDLDTRISRSWNALESLLLADAKETEALR